MGESKRKEEYICFPEHLCTCYSFFYDIVGRGEQLCVSAVARLFYFVRPHSSPILVKFSIRDMDAFGIRKKHWAVTAAIGSSWLLEISFWFWVMFLFFQCKHQLAARLAEAVGKHQEMEVTDEELAHMLAKLWLLEYFSNAQYIYEWLSFWGLSHLCNSKRLNLA